MLWKGGGGERQMDLTANGVEAAARQTAASVRVLLAGWSMRCGWGEEEGSVSCLECERQTDLRQRFVMTNKFYEGSARNWFTLDSVEIVQNGTTAKFRVSIISSPVEYSFHCQLVGTRSQYGARLIPLDDKEKTWDVVISDFQIQAFSVQNITFSYASDCTSFFTPAIWMALVTSLVLLLILTYGIHMIVHLTTNSRFDNPKDPRLSIPETE